MSVSEAVSYIGAPFQASVGVAKQQLEGTWEPAEGALLYAVPASNTIVNPSFELTTSGWEGYSSRSHLAPVLATTSRPGLFETGLAGLTVGPNASLAPRTDYVWSDAPSAPSLRSGERYLLRVYVSGAASRGRPLRLGVRLPSGVVSQADIRPVRNGVVKVTGASGWLMEGVFTAPRGLESIQLVLYQASGSEPRRFGADAAVLGPVAVAGADQPSFAKAALRYVAPTYSRLDVRDVLDREETYRSYVDIEGNLTTNSVFVSMSQSLSWASLVVMATIAFSAAALAGHASRYSSLFVLTAVVVAYCFAELWRVYLFNAGIVHCLVLALVATPLLHGAIASMRRRLLKPASGATQ
jgi:hypothetical protein